MQRNHQKALEYYNIALNLYTSDSARNKRSSENAVKLTLHNMAIVYCNLKEYTTAIECFGRAHSIDCNETADRHYQVGLVLDQHRRIKDALRYYRIALDMYEKMVPRHRGVYVTLAKIRAILSEQGHYEEALEVLFRVLNQPETATNQATHLIDRLQDSLIQYSQRGRQHCQPDRSDPRLEHTASPRSFPSQFFYARENGQGK